MKHRSRIAQDTAHAWARHLDLPNPLAKFVLIMLTSYVNGEGVCFVGVDSLSEDCSLDRKAVMRRLEWLETEAKVIRRQKQWVDSKGVRNGDSRGRRTSDLIVLLMPGVEEFSAEILDDECSTSEGLVEPDLRSVSSPVSVPLEGPIESLNMNTNKKDARARARVEPRAPARSEPVSHVWVKEGTRWWRDLAIFDPDHMRRVPKHCPYPGSDPEHAGSTGWYFLRTDLDKALHHAKATGPPDHSSATDYRNDDGTEFEAGNSTDARQSEASL